MSRELKYYHDNKEKINAKRRLDYALKTEKIDDTEHFIKYTKIINKLTQSELNNEKLLNIYLLLNNCDINELIILSKYVHKKIQRDLLNE